MNAWSVASHAMERRSEERKESNQYYSAEFLVEGMDTLYQFKVWDVAPSSISVLVNEKSRILPCLRVGDTLKVKYYSDESGYPTNYQKTAIRHITRNDDGRLKGHFLVGLEIIDGQS
jgi:hypothetical protein